MATLINYLIETIFSVHVTNQVGNTATIATSAAVQDRAHSQTPVQTRAQVLHGADQDHAQYPSHLLGRGPNQYLDLDPDLQLAVPALPQNVKFECLEQDLHPGV